MIDKKYIFFFIGLVIFIITVMFFNNYILSRSNLYLGNILRWFSPYQPKKTTLDICPEEMAILVKGEGLIPFYNILSKNGMSLEDQKNLTDEIISYAEEFNSDISKYFFINNLHKDLLNVFLTTNFQDAFKKRDVSKINNLLFSILKDYSSEINTVFYEMKKIFEKYDKISYLKESNYSFQDRFINNSFSFNNSETINYKKLRILNLFVLAEEKEQEIEKETFPIELPTTSLRIELRGGSIGGSRCKPKKLPPPLDRILEDWFYIPSPPRGSPYVDGGYAYPEKSGSSIKRIKWGKDPFDQEGISFQPNNWFGLSGHIEKIAFSKKKLSIKPNIEFSVGDCGISIMPLTDGKIGIGLVCRF